MPDQITTVAQLSGYPLGAVFTDIEGGVWMIDSRNPATGACWMLSPETVRMSAKHVLRKWGPLTPVWRPDQAVGSPKVASKSDSLPSDPDAVGHYRKLPVTVEAIRYTPGTNCAAVAEFLGDDPGDLTCAEEADHEQTEYAIATPEGVMHASPGDYIIRGVHGEFYPIKGSIFRETYVPADTPVIPGQNPTAEAVADALIKYETGGCCGFGTTCGLCDCGKADETPEQTQTRDAMELDRARAVLAAVPEAQNPAQQPSGCLPGPLDEAQRNDHDQHTPQRCAPSEDELAKAVTSGWVEGFDEFGKYGQQFDSAAARAVLTQAQAEALRQAARDWSDWDGLSAPEEWLARRAAAIESGATHG